MSACLSVCPTFCENADARDLGLMTLVYKNFTPQDIGSWQIRSFLVNLTPFSRHFLYGPIWGPLGTPNVPEFYVT